MTLVEQYPPGHVRAASGGESRLIRFSHGANDWYTRSAWRARELWQELERDSGEELFVPSGVAWFLRSAEGWGAEAERVLQENSIPVERLAPDGGCTPLPELRRPGPGLDPLRAGSGSAARPGCHAGHLRAGDRARCPLRERHGCARGRGRPRRGRAPRGRPRRLGGRRLARRALPRPRRSPRDEAGRVLLRRPRRLAGAVGSGLGRLRGRHLRRRRARRTRLQGEPGHRGARLRPRRRGSRPLEGEGAGGARLPRAPLSRARPGTLSSGPGRAPTR